MSSSTLQAEICINEANIGETISGYLDIVSSEDILIDDINGEVYFEARGRMNGYKNDLISFPIITKPTLIKANEENIFPFTFTINSSIESYEGQNVSFTYTCEVIMKVNSEDFKKLGLSLMSSIKSFMTSDKRLRTLTQFEVKDHKNTYKVQETGYNFKLQANLVIPIFVAILLFLIYLFFVPEKTGVYIFMGLVIVVLAGIFAHSFIKSSLGKLSMHLEDEGANFKCTIEKTKKFKLKEQYVYYEIIEEVVDKRGTKSSTSRRVLHTSPLKEMKNLSKETEFLFPYVSNPDYKSLEIGDVTIFWQMCVTGVSNLGLKLKYTSTFEVVKNKPIINEDVPIVL